MTKANVAILTPPGRAAIASVAIWGGGAETLVEAHLVLPSRRPLGVFPRGRILFGHWRHHASQLAEEEVVVVRHDVDSLELHCHGGAAAANSIVQALVAGGAAARPPQAWVRARTAGRLEASAAILLAEAETERTAAILLDQWRGALRRELEQIIRDIEQGRAAAALLRLEKLTAAARIGQCLTRGWRVVIAGPPNAGKSTLINRLLGYDRSIVHHQPGTTRDRVTARTALEGWPLELIDTAGLREAGETIEAAGIELAVRAAESADLVVWLHDLSQTSQALLPELPAATMLPGGPVPRLLVANKLDLAADGETPPGWLAVSAKTGAGFEELTRSIVAALVPESPAAGDPVPFQSDQSASIARAAGKLRARRGAEAAAAAELRLLLAD